MLPAKKPKVKKKTNKIQVLLYLNYTKSKQIPFPARLKKITSPGHTNLALQNNEKCFCECVMKPTQVRGSSVIK